MKQFVMALVAGAVFMSPLLAQESDDEEQVEPAAEEELPENNDDIDEAGLDVQGFEEEDDDDFVPTEDIPADQSIPFPTDI